jgi:hypothetical protein
MSLPDPIDEARVRAALERAFAKLRIEYEQSGGWLYPGPKDAEEDWGWIGPYAWWEADFAHRYAMLLEEDFPGAVHLEMPINERMRADLDPLPEGVKRRNPQYIDIVVTDLASLDHLPATARGAGAAFRSRRHEAFIEVKWFPKAAKRWDGPDFDRFIRSVPADIERLDAHLNAGRCAVAAMLVVDDRGRFLPRLSQHTLREGVLVFGLTPPPSTAQ